MAAHLLLSQLLDRARQAGARAADGVHDELHVLRLDWRDGAARPSEQARHRLRFRIYLDGGRWARGECTAPDPQGLEAALPAALEQAMERARRSEPDPLAGPAEHYDYEERGTGIRDRRLERLRFSDRLDLLDTNAADVAASPDAQLLELGYREELLHRSYASSRGAWAREDSTRFSLWLALAWRPSGRVLRDGVQSRHYASVATVPLAADLLARLAFLHRPARLPPEAQPVILSPRALSQLLRSLGPAFDARRVAEGRSFLSRYRGRRLASRKLHVIDDPSLPGALRTRVFDDEGVPPVAVPVLREGVTGAFFRDLRSARQAGQRPTGHCWEGELRHSNLIVHPGTRSRNAIGMDLGDYLQLDHFHEPSPVDPRTGRVHGACDLLVFEDNQAVGALPGVPVDLPVRRLLLAVREVAGDQWRMDEVDACSAVLEGVYPPFR